MKSKLRVRGREITMKKLFVFLCAMIIISGCAKSLQMPVQECANIDPNEGIVVGSVLVKGGKDLFGRTSWLLHVEGMDPDLKYFSIDVKRGGDEAIFVTKMLAGKYHFSRLQQPITSTFEFDVDVPFTVYPEKTVYIGRLVIEFPEGLINIGTPISYSIEDAKDQTLASAEKTHGDLVRNAVTKLMSTW